MKKYFIYGLNIESEIDLPGFTETEEITQVSVKFGKVPEYINNFIAKGVCYEARPDQFLLNVLNVGKYYITNGNAIIIEPAENADNDSIRLFLLGSAFGALFHQLKFLPLHASVVNINGHAVAFSGISGVGKSTLAAAFASKGFEIITDDIALVSFNNNIPYVASGPSHIKLWSDSLKTLGITSKKEGKIRKELEKYFVQTTISANHLAPLKKVYILNVRNVSEIETIPINGIEKFTVLRNHTYRVNFVKGLGVENSHFELASKLAGNIEVNRLYRGTKGFEIEKLVLLILNDLVQNDK